VDGEVVEVPFLQRDFQPGQALSVAAADKAQQQAADDRCAFHNCIPTSA